MAQERLLDEFPPVSYDQWRDQVEKDLKGASFDKKLVHNTHGGIEIQPVYTAEGNRAAADREGLPGFAPYLRGRDTSGNVRGGWKICQEFSDLDPKAAQKAVQGDLARGVSALWIRFDRTVRAGVAPDAKALPGAGDGVLCATLSDLEALLDGVDLTIAPVALDAGGNALVPAAFLIALAKQRGIELETLEASWCCDPLGALADDGGLAGSLDASLAAMTDLAAWSAANALAAKTVLISTSPYHDAGATAIQEIAFALATGVDYLRQLTAAELSIDAAASQIGFQFSVGRDFFTEIAKLRAARLAWARVVSACGGGEAAQAMTLHARTSARSKTQRDPWVNLLRVTTEVLAASVGGANSIASSAFDEALGGPDEFSRRIASNTQQILIDESHVAQVIDPAGGSWYVEHLSRELAHEAWLLFQKIEGKGGMRAFLVSGDLEDELDEVVEKRRKLVGLRRDPVTGVSEFPNVDEDPLRKDGLDSASVRAAFVASIQAAEMPSKCEAALADLKAASETARSDGSKMAAAIQAAQAGASVEAISEALFAGSESERLEALPLRRTAAPFEALRDASDARLAQKGERPTMFSANMGPIPKHKARASFAKNFFEAAGLAIAENDGFADQAAAVRAFQDSGAEVAVICSSDDLYEALVPGLARALHDAGAKRVLLAGRPGSKLEEYEAAGVDRFIYIGCDVLETLEWLLDELGVSR